MRHQSREEKQTNEGRKLDRLLSTSGLLLSVACCIAIIHVELRLREHHRLISHCGTFFIEMEAEIRRKVQENSENGRWQVGRNSHLEGEVKRSNIHSGIRNSGILLLSASNRNTRHRSEVLVYDC